MEAITEQTIAELKTKHGEIHLLTAKGGHEIIVRAPNDAEWGSFLDEREKIGARALKGLVRSCLLHPSSSDFKALLDKKPALANVFGAKLLEIAGMEEEAVAKKL